MPSRQPLTVWLYGTRIATLREDSNDELELHWTDEAYERWGGGSRVMSHLLPMSVPGKAPHPARVKVFVDGLAATTGWTASTVCIGCIKRISPRPSV